jgi:hypothetical protein
LRQIGAVLPLALRNVRNGRHSTATQLAAETAARVPRRELVAGIPGSARRAGPLRPGRDWALPRAVWTLETER